MAIYLEQFEPDVQANGLNTNKPASFGTTVAISGATTSAGITATGTIATSGFISAANTTATTAGGSGTGVTIGQAGTAIIVGSGVPTVTTAPQGSLYLRTDGSSSSTRMYVASNSSGSWVAVTTAS